ncbi:MAG: hypothetical protein M1836_007336 [Candelina mexicana]|nr:MAG: hypothetical protein M1836_007336 [Candelina mexicana]
MSSPPQRGSPHSSYGTNHSTPSGPSQSTEPISNQSAQSSNPPPPNPTRRTNNTSPSHPITAPPNPAPVLQPPLPARFRVLELNDTITYHTANSILYTLYHGSWELVVIAANEQMSAEIQTPCFVRHPQPLPPAQPPHVPFRPPHEAIYNRFYHVPDQQQTEPLQQGEQQGSPQTQPQAQQQAHTTQAVQQAPHQPVPKYRCIEPDRSIVWREMEDIHRFCKPGYWSVTLGSGRIWRRI